MARLESTKTLAVGSPPVKSVKMPNAESKDSSSNSNTWISNSRSKLLLSLKKAEILLDHYRRPGMGNIGILARTFPMPGGCGLPCMTLLSYLGSLLI